ncbi:hypothetical protein [Dyadobacter aurulentus]|uniref:hypothetical protein n=1 Tax=Dyadobacter sp. UC 10 TaxID=2605428 RepID=UPI0011F3971C|nr:hypothetical protein [Dyadobacter sp. UC 10]KAA0991028.1 hypothetical protein FXO21_13105 [Dyadobacter sp. UC 10]
MDHPGLLYGKKFSQQATTIGLPLWYGLGSITGNIPQIGLKGLKLVATVPLMTLAFVLTPTPAGENSTVDQYVLNSKGGKQNLWDDQLSPLSNQQLKEKEAAAKGAKDTQLQQKIKKEWKRRGESNQQKRNSRGY